MNSFLDIIRIIVSIGLLWGSYHLYRAYRKSKLLLPEEVGAVSLYSEQAGGSFGKFNWTIPFVRVSCYMNFVAIHCWNCNFVLKMGDVQSIKKESFVADGIVIDHNRRNLPKKLIIWPRNISKLIKALETSLDLANNIEEQAVRNSWASR